MASIQFDSVEILDSTHIPQFVKHESAPDRQLTTLTRAREDGSVLISDRYDRKTIKLQGTLIGSSSDDLDSKIDTFKELFSRVEKNLDISWNGSTRRYVATCTAHEFNRDFYNINAVPWTAEFTVLSSEGKDTTTTIAVNANLVTVTTPGSDSFTLAGSKPPKPVITIDGSTDAPNSVIWPSTCLGVQYKNTDTGEKIIITNPGTWVGAGKSIVINCDQKLVTETITNGSATETAFYGIFPSFAVGTNNIEITCGGIVALQTTDPTTLPSILTIDSIAATNQWRAQAFRLQYSDATFQQVAIRIGKNGSPGTVTVSIYSDNAGYPGSLITGATGTISAATITAAYGAPAYYTASFAAPISLSANTQYHIVVSAAGVSGSDVYSLLLMDNILADGSPRFTSSNSGGAWSSQSRQFAFRVYFGGLQNTGKIKHSVTYKKTYL